MRTYAVMFIWGGLWLGKSERIPAQHSRQPAGGFLVARPVSVWPGRINTITFPRQWLLHITPQQKVPVRARGVVQVGDIHDLKTTFPFTANITLLQSWWSIAAYQDPCRRSCAVSLEWQVARSQCPSQPSAGLSWGGETLRWWEKLAPVPGLAWVLLTSQHRESWLITHMWTLSNLHVSPLNISS